jgi:hypothetical protein
MAVGVDQSRHHQPAPDIDHLGIRGGEVPADPCDAAVPDKDVCNRQVAEVGVETDYVTATK